MRLVIATAIAFAALLSISASSARADSGSVTITPKANPNNYEQKYSAFTSITITDCAGSSSCSWFWSAEIMPAEIDCEDGRTSYLAQRIADGGFETRPTSRSASGEFTRKFGTRDLGEPPWRACVYRYMGGSYRTVHDVLYTPPEMPAPPSDSARIIKIQPGPTDGVFTANLTVAVNNCEQESRCSWAFTAKVMPNAYACATDADSSRSKYLVGPVSYTEGPGQRTEQDTFSRGTKSRNLGAFPWRVCVYKKMSGIDEKILLDQLYTPLAPIVEWIPMDPRAVVVSVDPRRSRYAMKFSLTLGGAPPARHRFRLLCERNCGKKGRLLDAVGSPDTVLKYSYSPRRLPSLNNPVVVRRVLTAPTSRGRSRLGAYWFEGNELVANWEYPDVCLAPGSMRKKTSCEA